MLHAPFRMAIAAILTTSVFALGAQAATIQGVATGLSDPDVVVDFNEVALSTGTNVTDQFAGFGVTFDPGVTYFTNVSPRPNFSGAAALDFSGTNVSITFTDNVSAFTGAMTANFGSMTLSALLDGVLVESFTHAFGTTGTTTSDNFFGFSGITFDEVLLDPLGSTSVALDKLSYTLAPVPLPAGLPLLLAGLGGLGLMARRNRRA